MVKTGYMEKSVKEFRNKEIGNNFSLVGYNHPKQEVL
jgi:hypothetical protein